MDITCMFHFVLELCQQVFKVFMTFLKFLCHSLSFYKIFLKFLSHIHSFMTFLKFLYHNLSFMAFLKFLFHNLSFYDILEVFMSYPQFFNNIFFKFLCHNLSFYDIFEVFKSWPQFLWHFLSSKCSFSEKNILVITLLKLYGPKKKKKNQILRINPLPEI